VLVPEPCLSWGCWAPECCMPVTAQLFGLTAPPPRWVCFHTHLRAEPPTVIRDCTVSESSSHADTPLQSSFTLSPARNFRPVRACLGFVPHRDITASVHSPQRAPSSCYVPSSGFLDLSTAFSADGSPGLFHPDATSRVGSRTRLSLSAQRSRLFAETFLRAGSSHAAHRLAPAATAQLARSEASFRAEQRSQPCAV
jgi:hypothetical protein